MMSIFQNSDESPYHISVGAILVNAEGKVRAHYRTTDTTPEEYRVTLGGLTECYTLMRETLENGETLEEAVLRGIREEFGAEGRIVKYVGAILITVHAKARTFEKVTLYFEVELVSEGERHVDDGEGHTELVWEDPEFLIERMRAQGEASDREDLDESKVLEAYLTHKT